MKLYLTTTLYKILDKLNDITTTDSDYDLKIEGTELTLKFDERTHWDLLGTDFERYFNKGDNSLTIDLNYYIEKETK